MILGISKNSELLNMSPSVKVAHFPHKPSILFIIAQDLNFVSKDYEGIKSFKRSSPLYVEWEIDLPVDFICYTPEEYKKFSKVITIARESKRKGVEII